MNHFLIEHVELQTQRCLTRAEKRLWLQEQCLQSGLQQDSGRQHLWVSQSKRFDLLSTNSLLTVTMVSP